MTSVDEPPTAAQDGTDPTAVDDFISRWKESGGSEIANFQPFVIGLCDLLGLDAPDPSEQKNEKNDYVFERRVDYKFEDGTTAKRRIDLYKRDCFVLEAKQSAKRVAVKKADPCQPDLIPEDATQIKAGTATRGTGRWDRVMRAAKKQAEDYARALPKEHGWPPFILVVDVGHVIEVYADFSGQGKNYAQFPDRAGYSIPLEGLRDPAIRARLRAIWSDPQALDPARRSAEVSRDIAERLARIARNLEGKHHPKEVAEFLMRCLFTMFAEDVGLLPKKSFEKLLGEVVETPENFAPALESLWRVMDEGGYAPHLNTTIKRFNGALFRKRKAIALEKEDIRELQIAAGRDWRDVEPAIFGTLLERALDKRERAKLGAHYTPRAYVERLVVPTIVEPLRADWEEALARAHALEGEGRHDAALTTIRDFHHTLCTVRVLDPACGTGNFLYVSLELMKRLEGEVLDALDELGEPELGPRLAMEGETVSPRQFYGLEINSRAVAIADLVLWIGYLKWQLRTVRADRHRRARPARLRHDQGAGRDPGLGQAGTAPRRARRAALPLGRCDHEAPPDHGRGDSRPRRHGGALPLREPATRRLAGGRVHRGQSALHRRQGHARGVGRRLCRGGVEGPPETARGRRLRHALLGRGSDPPAAQADEGENEPAAPLRLHHHQLRDPDLLPPRHRAARASEGTVVPSLRRA